jgi:hypothetical protein
MSQYRENYKNGFIADPRSPLAKEDLEHLDFYPANPKWKLDCKVELAENQKPFEMPTYSGVTRTYILYAKAVCPNLDGQKVELEIYKNIHQPINPLYKNHLFLPFKDETNTEDTYGGGRYINMTTLDIINQKMTIDFNKSYNPWCAYSDGYNCPIPPRANRLEFKIEAGEKNYLANKKSRVQ